MVITVPSWSLVASPSMAIMKLWLRLFTSRRISLVSGSTMGRVLMLWGATGVSVSTFDCGTTIGPPLLSE